MSELTPPQFNPAEYKQSQDGMGTTSLVMGILQFFCLGPIGTVLAIVFGYVGMQKAKQGLATNGGVAKAGFILGIIGAGLSILAFIFWLVIVVAAGATSGS
jgi:hypothetical protein